MSDNDTSEALPHETKPDNLGRYLQEVLRDIKKAHDDLASAERYSDSVGIMKVHVGLARKRLGKYVEVKTEEVTGAQPLTEIQEHNKTAIDEALYHMEPRRSLAGYPEEYD
jgi:hypothetical protein